MLAIDIHLKVKHLTADYTGCADSTDEVRVRRLGIDLPYEFWALRSHQILSCFSSAGRAGRGRARR